MKKNLYERFIETVKRVEKELLKVNTIIDGYLFIHPSGKSKKVHIFKGNEHIAVIGGGKFEIKTKSKDHADAIKAIREVYSKSAEPEKGKEPVKNEEPKKNAKNRKNQ